MGQNRRYDLVGRDIERSDRARALEGVPMGLSMDEVAATGQRRDARQPISVTARVQFQVAHVEARETMAEAIACADAAVLLRWKTPNGREHYAWVYAGAVRRR